MLLIIMGAVASFLVIFTVFLVVTKRMKGNETKEIDDLAWRLGEQRRQAATNDEAWRANKNMRTR